MTASAGSAPPTATQSVTYTICEICEMLCGLKVTTAGDRLISIEPDRDNPYSWRDYCVKGATAGEVRDHPLRLRSPMKRVGDRYVAATYEEAIDDISTRLKRILAESGPQAIADYSGNPSGFSFANAAFQGALMDAIGTTNRFWVGSIDQNAVHVVLRAMYGSEWAGLVPDIDDCDCFLLIGTNPVTSGMCWFGQSPQGWERIQARVARGGDLIVVDPRLTETAIKAKLHVAILPEQDWAFLLGVIRVVFESGWLHQEDCAEALNIDVLRELSLSVSLADLAARCDVPESTIRDVASRFGTARTAMCLARTGPSQGRNGVLTEWLAHALNLITGRTDRPGGRSYNTFPLDLMRIGSQLFPARDTPSRVRGLKPVAGAHSLAELVDEIVTPGPGQIRALFINAGNPVVSGPQGRALDQALAQLDLLIAIDMFQRVSHRHAHWLIPGAHFLERGQFNALMAPLHDRPFAQVSAVALPPPPGVRHEWEFLRDLAAAMGLQLFGGTLPPDPRALTEAILEMGGQVTLDQVAAHPHGMEGGAPRFGQFRKSLLTPQKRIDAAPTSLVELAMQRLKEPLTRRDANRFPLQIITRRRKQMMNSWLTETAGQYQREKSGDLIEVNPADAVRFGVNEGDQVQVQSRVGTLTARLSVSQRVRAGVAVMEHGWGSALLDPSTATVAFLQGNSRNELVANDDLDPLSGVARLNGTPVTLSRVKTDSGG